MGNFEREKWHTGVGTILIGIFVLFIIGRMFLIELIAEIYLSNVDVDKTKFN